MATKKRTLYATTATKWLKQNQMYESPPTTCQRQILQLVKSDGLGGSHLPFIKPYIFSTLLTNPDTPYLLPYLPIGHMSNQSTLLYPHALSFNRSHIQ